jgi:pimeloyl-ACP methyl ester carboxylesterase
MPKARANGIEIEFDTFGDPDDPTVLLVMGLGAQMVLWDEAFCLGLAGRGLQVVRFDNRDVGLSTWLDHLPVPDPREVMAAARAGGPVEVPYRLSDMADDAACLLDAIGVERAHVVGASMGGMIAQTLAVRHRDRVASLTSIMSTTGDPSLSPGRPEAMALLVQPLPRERERYVEHSVATQRVIGSPGFPFDEARVRERSARSYDRGFHPEGMARQLAAIIAAGSRREALREADVPALVVHGDADPLIPVDGGLDTHAALPDAELLVVEGMGHDLPVGVWERIQDGITALARRAAR